MRYLKQRSPNPAPVAPPVLVLVLPCTPKPPTRPAAKSKCLGNPLGQAGAVSDWGHQALCLRVLGAHFGHNFAHILHAG
jgi:hypothetical protein